MKTLAGKKNRGIALIIVLIMVVVLGILAGGFAYTMKVETTLARRAGSNSELDWLGRAGVEVSKWILANDSGGQGGQGTDSTRNYWNKGVGDSNSPMASVTWPMQVGDGFIERPEIIDLDSKFNINVADEMILKQAMTLIGVDAAQASTVASSILDWRDPDSDTHMGGTESDYYEGLNPPYYAKDGPIDDMSELLLVRGVTPAMYWGSSGGGMPAVMNRPDQGIKSAFEEPTYAVGIADLFTAISGRLVNINTASAAVLQIFPDIDENVAQAIITARAGPDGVERTEDDMPFRSPQELGRVPGFSNPQAIPLLARYFSVRSLCFEARVKVDMRGTKREYVAILRRNGPKDIQTLNLYWK